MEARSDPSDDWLVLVPPCLAIRAAESLGEERGDAAHDRLGRQRDGRLTVHALGQELGDPERGSHAEGHAAAGMGQLLATRPGRRADLRRKLI